jgi:hypothetical protein
MSNPPRQGDKPKTINLDDVEREALEREGYYQKRPPKTPQPNEEAEADEMLIMRLLAGFHVDQDGREVTSYLKPNSVEERKARVVLARQLRDGTLGSIPKELLALAIDPSTPSPMPNMRPTRKIKFENPTRGKPPTWARDLAIIYFINRERRTKSVEQAVGEAADHFGLERSRTWEIWTQWNQLINPSAK